MTIDYRALQRVQCSMLFALDKDDRNKPNTNHTYQYIPCQCMLYLPIYIWYHPCMLYYIFTYIHLVDFYGKCRP